MSSTKLNHKVTTLSITVFFNFNEFLKFNYQFIIARQSPCTWISQQPPLSLRSFTAWCCFCARHCCSINYKIWTDENCLVSIPHTCVNGVFFEGGSHSRVVGAMGINSLAAQPGFVVGALIFSRWQMCFKCKWRITYPKFLHVYLVLSTGSHLEFL